MINLPSFQQMIRAGIQSSTIMTLADIATQFVIEGKTSTAAMVTNDTPTSSSSTTSPVDTSKESLSSTTASHNNQVKNNDSSSYDLRRTVRWTVAGLLLHGPYFLVGFSWLDQRFSNPIATTTIKTASSSFWASLKVVAKKTMTGQIVLFPPYLVIFFSFMGLLEGHPNIPDKLRTHVPQAFVAGSVYWPIVNSINFAFVPSTGRVPYLAMCSGVWNSYLSWSNNR